MPSFKDPRTVLLKGTIMQAGVRNRNGRVYDRECLQKAVDDFNKRKKESKLFMKGDAVYANALYIRGDAICADMVYSEASDQENSSLDDS